MKYYTKATTKTLTATSTCLYTYEAARTYAQQYSQVHCPAELIFGEQGKGYYTATGIIVTKLNLHAFNKAHNVPWYTLDYTAEVFANRER